LRGIAQIGRARACLPTGRHGVRKLLKIMWFVYRITNKKKSYFYTGITQDVNQRLRKHNEGATKSTRPYRPFDKIKIIKICPDRNKARKWEKYYKSGVGREKLKIGE